MLSAIFVAGDAIASDEDVIQNCPDISVQVYNLTLQICPSPN